MVIVSQYLVWVIDKYHFLLSMSHHSLRVKICAAPLRHTAQKLTALVEGLARDALSDLCALLNLGRSKI